MKWLKENWKDLLKVIAAFAIVIVAVMGFVWEDYAETPFWSNFWFISAIAAIVIWVVGWVILNGRQNNK